MRTGVLTFVGRVFSFLLGVYPGVELLGLGLSYI